MDSNRRHIVDSVELGDVAAETLHAFECLAQAGMPIPRKEQERLLGEALLVLYTSGESPSCLIDWIINNAETKVRPFALAAC